MGWEPLYKMGTHHYLDSVFLTQIECSSGSNIPVASLVLQGKSYQVLRTVIYLDIERGEESITCLQESLTSVCEVVLQNCHVLDLLFFTTGKALYRSNRGMLLLPLLLRGG